jgi:hypothetical protein
MEKWTVMDKRVSLLVGIACVALLVLPPLVVWWWGAGRFAGWGFGT